MISAFGVVHKAEKGLLKLYKYDSKRGVMPIPTGKNVPGNRQHTRARADRMLAGAKQNSAKNPEFNNIEGRRYVRRVRNGRSGSQDVARQRWLP